MTRDNKIEFFEISNRIIKEVFQHKYYRESISFNSLSHKKMYVCCVVCLGSSIGSGPKEILSREPSLLTRHCVYASTTEALIFNLQFSS